MGGAGDKPGMAVSREEWSATEIHRASTYSCGKCGEEFPDPEAFYEHLDAIHDRSDDGMRLKGKTRSVPGQAKQTRRKV